MRQFETGATRSNDAGKINYEGFLSPLVLRRFGEFMNKHRVQEDGQLRAADNWQRGITEQSYMESMFRHFMDVWAEHREVRDPDCAYDYVKRDVAVMEDSLCALMFNVMGYLHEYLKVGIDKSCAGCAYDCDGIDCPGEAANEKPAAAIDSGYKDESDGLKRVIAANKISRNQAAIYDPDPDPARFVNLA